LGSYLANDPDYLKAKRIRRGEERIDARFDEFVERFRSRFGIVPKENFDKNYASNWYYYFK